MTVATIFSLFTFILQIIPPTVLQYDSDDGWKDRLYTTFDFIQRYVYFMREIAQSTNTILFSVSLTAGSTKCSLSVSYNDRQ